MISLARGPYSTAPGCRERSVGTLYAVGHGGNSWSSSIPAGSSDARYLGFNNSWLNPQSNNYRAYGFPVRCLQE